MLKPILLAEDDPRDLERTLLALERSPLANELGASWALVNEPPPGSYRVHRPD